jgi:hypothetical protein
MLTSEGRRLRALVAIGTRHHGENHPAVLDARRALRTEKAVSAIRALVDADPPLRPEQLARIAAAVHEREPGQS